MLNFTPCLLSNLWFKREEARTRMSLCSRILNKLKQSVLNLPYKCLKLAVSDKASKNEKSKVSLRHVEMTE